MFSKEELAMIAKALEMAERSAARLAAKEGQPETVAEEYRKYQGAVIALSRKVVMAMDEARAPKKKKAADDTQPGGQ